MALDMTVAAPSGVTFKDELVAMLAHHSANQPRSQQRRLGPSEVGHPCTRKLAYGLTLAPDVTTAPATRCPAWWVPVRTRRWKTCWPDTTNGTASASSSRTVSNPHRVSPGRWTPRPARPCRDRLEVPRHHQDEHCPPRPAPEFSTRCRPISTGSAFCAPDSPRIVRIAFIHAPDSPPTPTCGKCRGTRDRHGRHQSHDVDDRHGSRPPGRPASRPVRGVPRHPVPMRLLPWHHLKPAGPYGAPAATKSAAASTDP